MATAITLSSSLDFINGVHRRISPTPPPSFRSLLLLRRLNHRVASIRRPQSRRRYEADERFFDGYEYDVVAEDDEFSDDDEDETESSVDLLIRFLRSMFKKISKRAKKASRRILPGVMSPQLVSFAVDGILLLASLSVVRAFLEVICNLGGTVFAVILLIRLFWAAVSYFQTLGDDFNGSRSGRSSFGGAPEPLT